MADSEVPAIELRGLSKSYDGVLALQGIDLRVDRGELLGFLGPNGAGKTTAIRCMLDLIRPTTGSIRIAGLDPQRHPVAVRRRTGYLPGELHFDDNLSTSRLLNILASLRGKRANSDYVDDLCERLQLDRSKSIKNLSKGNKQKVGIIQALMHQPELLLLDEPTSGLDPLIQQEVLQICREAAQSGSTVFFCSHVLSEVEALAERVAVVREGRIVEMATTRELLARPLRQVKLVLARRLPSLERLRSIPGVRQVELQIDSPGDDLAAAACYHLQIEGDMDPLVKGLADCFVKEIAAEPATLEDIFLTYYADSPARPPRAVQSAGDRS